MTAAQPLTVFVNAWLRPGRDFRDLDGAKVAEALYFHAADMSSHGYVLVGQARISVALDNYSAIVATHVATLRGQQRQILADAQAASTKLERRINELMAITLDTSAASAADSDAGAMFSDEVFA